MTEILIKVFFKFLCLGICCMFPNSTDILWVVSVKVLTRSSRLRGIWPEPETDFPEMCDICSFLIRLKKKESVLEKSRKCLSFWDTKPNYTDSGAWDITSSTCPQACQAVVLAWSVFTAKLWDADHENCTITQCDFSAWRTWNWQFESFIPDLPRLSFERQSELHLTAQ